MQPVKDLSPAVDLIGPLPYTEQQTLLDAALPPGLRYYFKSHYLNEPTDDAIDAIVVHSTAVTSPLSAVTLQHYAGAVSRIPPEATAYSHRDATFALVIGSAWADPADDETHIRWTRAFFDVMEPFSRGVYVNFIGEGEKDRVREAYEPATYERLVALKNKYDPTNLFRLNHNIRPTVRRKEAVRL